MKHGSKGSHPGGGTHQAWALAAYFDLKVIHSQTLFFFKSLQYFILRLLPWEIEINYESFNC